MNAIHSGTAVTASPKLWIVSAISATLPVTSTTSNWSTAVTISPMNDHFTAHRPRSVVSSAGSSAPWVWACPPRWVCPCSP